MSGPQRDMNIIQNTVNSVSQLLREEGLEPILANKLEMERIDRSAKDIADACTVTAVIWVNAAIMHARITEARISGMHNLPSLTSAVADHNPARAIVDAWQKVLTKDYVPIFEVALELLTTVAFENRVGVSQALRRMAKDAVAIADEYADLGMDHAGELFNRVMGNQSSDGAFFTRPIAASMLAELALHATGETDWVNEETWDSLRCFDPACGSGTLLVAMLSAIKLRIERTCKDNTTAERQKTKFHTKAVENLMMGADINPVSLQLAGCQLTVGNVGVQYDRINLYRMDYGLIGDAHSRPTLDSVRTGSVELLTDARIIQSNTR